ncbi:MAG: HEAT repeat domain-containing protein [Gemmatimonadaceae bacterium]
MSILRSAVLQTGPNEPDRTRAADVSLRAIRATLRGAPSAMSQAAALELVAASNYPSKHRELQRVLDDESASPKLRYLAAVNLTRCETRAAHQILVNAVRFTDERLRAGVMRALGQIGGEDALKAIERVLPETTGSARTQAAFAATLIAHRLGLPSHDAPTPSAREVLEMAPEQGIRVHIRGALSTEVDRSLLSLGSRPYGIELAEDPMYEYRCDRCAGTIMLNREFTERDALSQLQKRKAIFGIGTVRDESSGTYSAAALFLTAPAGNGVRISVHLTNGSQLFVGDATVRGAEATWNLRAVRRLGAFPIRAEGDFKGGQLKIKLAASGTRIVQRERPIPVDVSVVRSLVTQSRA